MSVKNTLAAVITASLIASGQTPRRPKFDQFEVATIKPTGTQPGGRWIRMRSVDRFEARNHAVRTLIAAAFDMSPQAISGGPAWVDSGHWDIQAKTPGGIRPNFNEQMAMLAKALADLAPGDLAISFFSNSGTEAVEAALKLARLSTKRAHIVSTHNAYHGKTMGSLTATGRDVFKDSFQPLVPEFEHVPFGDLDALDKALPNAAAFIVEPIQCEGGVVIPPDG